MAQKNGQIWADNISTTNIQIFLEFLGQYKVPLISLTEVLFFRCLLSTRQNIEKTQYFETQYLDMTKIWILGLEILRFPISCLVDSNQKSDSNAREGPTMTFNSLPNMTEI